MDGGSSLNLLYQDTVRKMGIDPSRIKPTKTTFNGVIPGVESHCTGSITLEVVFGSPDNFRSEELIFHIVAFRSGYHALLGRTAFAKFMWYRITHTSSSRCQVLGGHNRQWKHRALASHGGTHYDPRSRSTNQPFKANHQFGDTPPGHRQASPE